MFSLLRIDYHEPEIKNWGYTIGKMKQYIYRKWLPSSEYTNTGIIDDFEYHDQRSIQKKPEIALYIAIRDKH